MNLSARSGDALVDALAANNYDLHEALDSLWDVRPNHFTASRVSVFREKGEIVEIDFKWQRLTDCALQHLSELTSLKRLNVHSSEITDEGLEELLALQNLEELKLGRTQVTTEGMSILQNLPCLRRLDVSATEVDNDGVREIAQIPTLEALYLDFCREVSDYGLAPLLDVEPLELLHLRCTRVTSAGAEDFTAAKPDCRVYR